MEDTRIVDLFWERSEQAIAESEKKYGRYCHYIAKNILHSDADADECVNDAYVKAWESIPPARPQRLSAYLGKIVRNIALNRYVHDHAQKRAAHTEAILAEMGDCVPDATPTDALSDELVLRDAINSFLGGLPEKTRRAFVRRYWYLSAVREIAEDLGWSESRVKVTLLRTRNKLKAHLEKEGIVL